MPQLTPREAALFAKAAYQVRDGTEPELAVGRAGANEIRADWRFDGLDALEAATGAVIRHRTGFGMVALGRPGMRHEGHVAVTLRGTFFTSPFDWMTNGNISFDRGPGGLPVHAGFKRVADQIVAQVGPPLAAARRPVHVIGHSLGGALAQLVALWLREAGLGEVHLYTFGAPRVVHSAHVATADRRLAGARRVFDIADPVPMIPIWPFAHGHGGPAGLRVGVSGGRIALGAHDMDSYIDRVRLAEWAGLQTAAAGIEIRRGVDYWIAEARRSTRIPGASAGLAALGHALNALLGTAEGLLGAFALGAVTTLDMLSTLLMTAADRLAAFDARLGEWVSLVLRWLGRPPLQGGLTAALLRWALELMTRAIETVARGALGRLG